MTRQREGRKDTAFWFARVPEELMEEFNKAYPDRGSKKLLTIAAIKRALEVRPLLDLEGISRGDFLGKR